MEILTHVGRATEPLQRFCWTFSRSILVAPGVTTWKTPSEVTLTFKASTMLPRPLPVLSTTSSMSPMELFEPFEIVEGEGASSGK